ncbi:MULTISPECIES: undecaprenyl-diphosphate phosphatase [Pseudoalteromonas]|jgi:undecaprenyl-diphosphatase|uniref:undecaprenyl-diphosphate phosphatase n=1 Tax=Pseudoalteromonas TaxID=53246 RepID=UPI000780E07B|nr:MULTISPECIES: undecaprenyl-diphosphate phosphatase [Gammaproteobacteria]MCF7501296.1 undecaprenyl-diphosphate phosphatase [Pseudoalteromonas sp. L1]RZF94687.1 undecaprenyl-diphosphate phosphatase [Pseudoalteromonas sp. CO302Y]RZG11314.1 undecaprenyl-diphosphate phosphatase [Pseudoalteromonas sp. CO133X]UJX24979.1 undecaprenyl-diphosphate phosphatase [Pseudoalteromonas sp. CF6-2]WOC25655.1 undecaprenyl-diphosphate phosphatase [Pseudoalteromonas sp. N1230-9]|tara:strand:- start:184 stop:984 length:801 start_codon:yes stop_codon:yes gene_type:complete
MSIIEIIVLALIQGLTEFLPISSSAHLILPSQILGWQDQGLAFDVAVHVGTLGAVVLYFRKEVVDILGAWFKSFGSQGATDDSKLGWWIIVGTIPAAILGLIFKDLIELYLRSAWVIAVTTILFGLLLWYADAKGKQTKTIYQLNWKSALMIGMAQAMAMIPGTSRSGITMTAGLMLGMNKQSAARFSFLLAIPVILMMGLYYTIELALGDHIVEWNTLMLGAGLSFISAYACIFFFLKVIERMGMMPFVIYRLLLGVGLFAFLML